jgi:hypothetical protein
VNSRSHFGSFFWLFYIYFLYVFYLTISHIVCTLLSKRYEKMKTNRVLGGLGVLVLMGFFAVISVSAVQPTNVTVSGSTAADVTPVVTGGGFINVMNNGAHVAATQTGLGTISIVNNGGVLTATNTGTGVMTINSTATGAVTVTNTGNGRITVNATGAAAIAIVHTGDEDASY